MLQGFRMKKILFALFALIFITGAMGCKAEAKTNSDDEKAFSEHSCELLILTESKQLYVFRDEELYKMYTVAVGRPTKPTPKGVFTVISKIESPYTEAYGTRWIGLSAPNIGIHGTNDPYSIGTEASSGCIRMGDADIEELYELIEIGTKVFIL
jgi:lipoprotein-anchoring transpeptidase ErfK/SrfK